MLAAHDRHVAAAMASAAARAEAHMVPQSGRPPHRTYQVRPTHGHYQPAAPPPPYGFIEFQPALPTQPPPSTTPPWRPTKRRARVSHARNASVQDTQSYIGMNRRRKRYRTALGGLKHCVCNFWVIFWEGPKRQPLARKFHVRSWAIPVGELELDLCYMHTTPVSTELGPISGYPRKW